MTFFDAIKICFKKFAEFNGRASRPEFWWFYLFEMLSVGAAIAIDPSGRLADLVAIVIFLPNLAVTVRRLHDTDRSGWWAALVLIPLIGAVAVLILAAKEGTAGPNRYDSVPPGAVTPA